jgi:hypothetical protein
MTDTAPLLRFGRSGGRMPADDEWLAVWPDRFEARRSVAGSRIGSFAGQLDATAMRELHDHIDALAGYDDIVIQTPMDGATESIQVDDGHTARLGSNEDVDGPWGALLRTVRRLLDGPVLESPRAAVALAVAARSAQLSHIGEQPLEVDASSVTVRVARLDADGLIQARWQGSATTPGAEDTRGSRAGRTWTEAGTGWTTEVPFDHGIDLAHGDYLQVRVMIDVREDGRARTGRLFVAVPGPTS